MSSEETEINTSGEPLQPSACTRGRPRARAGEKVGADISTGTGGADSYLQHVGTGQSSFNSMNLRKCP